MQSIYLHYNHDMSLSHIENALVLKAGEDRLTYINPAVLMLKCTQRQRD